MAGAATGPTLREALAQLDLAAVVAARWSGLGGMGLRGLRVVEAFGFEDRGAIAILEAQADSGEPVLLTLPSDDPLVPSGAAAGPSAGPGAGPWATLHGLATAGGVVAGDRGGRLVGRPIAAAGGHAAGPVGLRPAPGDQSHTSVILDERSILKLYRRLPPGPNPEVEVLVALAGAASDRPPVPALHGWIELVPGDRRSIALAIEQAFVPDAGDAFEAVADELAAALLAVERVMPSAGAANLASVPTLEAPRSLALVAGTGAALRALHVALASVDRPGFPPRPASAGKRDAWLTAAVERIDLAIEALQPVDPDLAATLAAAAPAIRADLAPLADPAIEVAVSRVHGDVHLGQVLATPDGVLFVDFEGDPLREPEERALPASPLRDVAGMLRSIGHVAQSGARRARERLGRAIGRDAEGALQGWVGDARRAFLDAYGGDGDALQPSLLRAFELEKAMLELRYAARFLPTWLYAPAGALPALVGGNEDGTRR